MQTTDRSLALDAQALAALDRCLDLAPPAREALLAELARHDAALHRRVALLLAHGAADDAAASARVAAPLLAMPPRCGWPRPPTAACSGRWR